MGWDMGWVGMDRIRQSIGWDRIGWMGWDETDGMG